MNGQQHLDERFDMSQPGFGPVALVQDMGQAASELRELQVLVIEIDVYGEPSVEHVFTPGVGRLIQTAVS